MSWDKKEPSDFIGASAKLDAAARMRDAARAVEDNLPPRQAGQTIPVAIIFVLAAGIAMLAPEGLLSNILGGAQTGIGALDQFLTGAAAVKMTGDAESDHLITVLVRGFMLFLLAGAAPFLAAVVARLLGSHRVNPFVACWGVLLALPLLYLLWGSF